MTDVSERAGTSQGTDAADPAGPGRKSNVKERTSRAEGRTTTPERPDRPRVATEPDLVVTIEDGSILGLNHVGLTTADLDSSVRFYGNGLGLRMRDRGETDSPELSTIIGLSDTKLRWAEFYLPGGQILEILEYVSPTGTPLVQRTCDPGSAHFAFEVRGIEALYDRLEQQGVTVRSRPVRIEEPGDWNGYRCIYAVDPDGFTVEFVEPPLA
jgi:catechol 2,3-dioxygenase-like lactoylglutathione lyase family enzyme